MVSGGAMHSEGGFDGGSFRENWWCRVMEGSKYSDWEVRRNRKRRVQGIGTAS